MTTEDTRTPLDVWFKFGYDPELNSTDEEPTFEANTFNAGDEYCVEWYHNAVGQVSRKWFPTYHDATKWLEEEGFQDFSS